MDRDFVHKAVDQAAAFRAAFVREHCRSDEDLIALAIAMAQQAEVIFRALGGGNSHVAQQFYAIADDLAAKE